MTSPSAARLEVVAGKAAGMSILVDDELTIGRHAQGAGKLADDEEISRSHARVTLDQGGLCAIEDLGSTNGTFVNGLRISVPQTLSEGDTIEVGATTIVVRELPEQVLEPIADAAAVAHQATVSHATPIATPEAPLDGAPEEPTAIPPPPLSLSLEIDFAAREARLRLADESEPVRLVFDQGAWRSAGSQ